MKTVGELVRRLRACDQDATLEVDGGDIRAGITEVEETFYNNPDNKYVIIRSDIIGRETEERKRELARLRVFRIGVEHQLAGLHNEES